MAASVAIAKAFAEDYSKIVSMSEDLTGIRDYLDHIRLCFIGLTSLIYVVAIFHIVHRYFERRTAMRNAASAAAALAAARAERSRTASRRGSNAIRNNLVPPDLPAPFLISTVPRYSSESGTVMMVSPAQQWLTPPQAVPNVQQMDHLSPMDASFYPGPPAAGAVVQPYDTPTQTNYQPTSGNKSSWKPRKDSISVSVTNESLLSHTSQELDSQPPPSMIFGASAYEAQPGQQMEYYQQSQPLYTNSTMPEQWPNQTAPDDYTMENRGHPSFAGTSDAFQGGYNTSGYYSGNDNQVEHYGSPQDTSHTNGDGSAMISQQMNRSYNNTLENNHLTVPGSAGFEASKQQYQYQEQPEQFYEQQQQYQEQQQQQPRQQQQQQHLDPSNFGSTENRNNGRNPIVSSLLSPNPQSPDGNAIYRRHNFTKQLSTLREASFENASDSQATPPRQLGPTNNGQQQQQGIITQNHQQQQQQQQFKPSNQPQMSSIQELPPNNIHNGVQRSSENHNTDYIDAVSSSQYAQPPTCFVQAPTNNNALPNRNPTSAKSLTQLPTANPHNNPIPQQYETWNCHQTPLHNLGHVIDTMKPYGVSPSICINPDENMYPSGLTNPQGALGPSVDVGYHTADNQSLTVDPIDGASTSFNEFDDQEPNRMSMSSHSGTAYQGSSLTSGSNSVYNHHDSASPRTPGSSVEPPDPGQGQYANEGGSDLRFRKLGNSVPNDSDQANTSRPGKLKNNIAPKAVIPLEVSALEGDEDDDEDDDDETTIISLPNANKPPGWSPKRRPNNQPTVNCIDGLDDNANLQADTRVGEDNVIYSSIKRLNKSRAPHPPN